MKRASFSLLSHLTRQKPRFATPRSSKLYPLSASPTCHLKPYNTNSVTINFRQFQSDSCGESLDPDKKLQEASSVHKKVKVNLQRLEDLASAMTVDDLMSAHNSIEGSKDEQLGLSLLEFGRNLDRRGEKSEKILSYATKALKVLLFCGDCNKTSLFVAMTLQLMGSANYYSKRFNDCLGCLNRANTCLSRLEEAGLCAIEDIRPVLHDVQLGLANVKTSMGRREEALCNLKKCLEIKEAMMEENSNQLGVANRDLAEAYVAVLNFKEALPYALKALEIHATGLGPNSVEVAHDRRVLAVIYTGLEDPKNAFFDALSEQNRSSQNVLKKWGLNSDHLLRAELDSANMHIAFGRYQEAMNTLNTVVHQTAKDSETQALTFIAMGKALRNLEKFADSKRCLKTAHGILVGKRKVSPVEVAEAYSEIALQYEYMYEHEAAITILKTTWVTLKEIPQERLSAGRVLARLGCLLLQTGEAKSALACFRGAAERLEESFGRKHFGMGYIYNCMGAACLKIDRPLWAAHVFQKAKDNLEASIGPRHADSIEVCQDLATLHGRMKSYTTAIGLQKRVVDALEGHGPPGRYRVMASRKLLEELMTKKASESECNSIDFIGGADCIEHDEFIGEAVEYGLQL